MTAPRGSSTILACIGQLRLSMERWQRTRCSLPGAIQQGKLLAGGPSPRAMPAQTRVVPAGPAQPPPRASAPAVPAAPAWAAASPQPSGLPVPQGQAAALAVQDQPYGFCRIYSFPAQICRLQLAVALAAGPGQIELLPKSPSSSISARPHLTAWCLCREAQAGV